MRSKLHIPPYWPSGIVPWVATIGALLVYIIAFIPDSRQHAPFTLLYNIGLLVFRSELGIQVVAVLGGAAHVVESLVLLTWCIRAGLAVRHTLGWVLLALLMGYPALAALQEGLAQPRKQRHDGSKPARAAGRRKHA